MCAYAGKVIVEAVRALLAAEDDLRELVCSDLQEAERYSLSAVSDVAAARMALVRSGDPRAVRVLDRLIDSVRERERVAG